MYLLTFWANCRSRIGVGEGHKQHHMKNYTMIHRDTSNLDSSRTLMSQKNNRSFPDEPEEENMRGISVYYG